MRNWQILEIATRPVSGLGSVFAKLVFILPVDPGVPKLHVPDYYCSTISFEERSW